jgi:alpha-glucosidase
VIANTGSSTVPLPAGAVLLASGPTESGVLEGDTTVWMRLSA